MSVTTFDRFFEKDISGYFRIYQEKWKLCDGNKITVTRRVYISRQFRKNQDFSRFIRSHTLFKTFQDNSRNVISG